MAITDPRDIPGLVVWYSAEAETGYADGAKAGIWHDQSGNSRDATTVAGGGALWKAATGPSGGASMRFDGTSFSPFYSLPANLMSGKTAGSLYARIKSDGGTNNPSPWAIGSSTDECHYPLSNGTVYDNFGLQAGARQSWAPTLTVTAWRRYRLWSAAGDWGASLDGTVQKTYTGGTVTFDPSPLLGRGKFNGGPDISFYGDMTTVLLFDHKLTTTEDADLTAWMDAHPSGGVPSASPTTSVTLTGSGQSNATASVGIATGPLSVTAAASGQSDATAIIAPVYGTDFRNLGAGRRRSGTAVVSVDLPVAVAPVPAYPIGVGTSVEAAFSLPAVTLDNGRAVNVQPAWFDQPAKRFRAVIGGQDVTFFRGKRLRVAPYKLTEPYGYGATTLEVDTVHPAHEVLGTSGTDLDWAKKGAHVRYDLVDPATNTVVKRGVYRGRVIGRRAGSSSLEIGGALSGPAGLRYRPVRLWRRVRDIGILHYDALRQIGVPCFPRLGPATGTELVDGGGQQYLGWLDYLQAMSLQEDGSQWTTKYDADKHAWRLVKKDLATKHATVWFDGARVVPDLVDDGAEQPNAYYLTGVRSDGRRINGRVDPGMFQGEAPPYPFTDNRTFGIGTTNADTDTGDGISVMHARLVMTGYLTRKDEDAAYSDDTADAIKELQDDAGLTQNGIMGPTTWKRLFDLQTTSLTMVGSHIEPMVIRTEVKRDLRTSTGAYAGRNPGYDASVLRVDRAVDVGAGIKGEQQLRQWARRDMNRSKNAWTGTVTLYSDVFAGEYAHGGASPQIMSKFELEAGMNLWVPNFQGGTLFHISYADPDPENNTVTLTVDTFARDAVDLAAILERDKEARANPEAQWIREHRSSRRTNDTVVEWDAKCGRLYEKVVCPANKWTTFPVISGGEGTVARLHVKTENNPAAFVMVVAGRKLGRGMLQKRLGNPFDMDSPITSLTLTNGGSGYASPPAVTISGGGGKGAQATASVGAGQVMGITLTRKGSGYTSTPSVSFSGGGGTGAAATAGIKPGRARWDDQAVQDWLNDDRLCVYVAGSADQPLGYWPKQHTDSAGDVTSNPITGVWHDDGSFGYRTFKYPVLWVAIYPDRDTVLKPQQMMWDQLEPGV